MRGVAALLLLPAALAAQASSYEATFDEFTGMRPRSERVARVEHLVLQRDVARFTLADGTLYLATPVAGRTVAAVFTGTGTFSFEPPSRVERDRLARIERRPFVEAALTDVVFLFADATPAELERSVDFAEGPVPGEVSRRIAEAVRQVSERDSRTVDPDLMGALLNGERGELFYAYIRREDGNPLLFRLDPDEVEGISLAGRVSGRHWSRQPEVITRFPRRGAAPAPARAMAGERRRQANVRHYAIDTRLAPSGIGEMGFTAAARLEIVADTVVGPWVAFELYRELRVDSASWQGGAPATVFRGRKSPLLWVRLERALRPGDVRTLTVHYHGDLIDRLVDFFAIKSSAVWYPRSLEGRSLARFDLTFHTHPGYRLASVGTRVDSIAAGRWVTTRWVTPDPIRNASFNLGLFEEYRVEEPGLPGVTLHLSERSHRKLARAHARQRRMRERVMADVTGSLRFFQQVFGPAPVEHFYATEIPYVHGEAFPGLVHLSWLTFHNTSTDGGDALFRAHEVAHQWWGIGVDFASYHDQWISEGFANFSALWYLQQVEREHDRYYDMLREWRSGIRFRKHGPGPISLGYRVLAATDDDQDDYQTIIYRKGAWVVHMLRVMMLDLGTMRDDRFSSMMREFYRTYRGRRASTEDFRRTVERHTGTDMGWFFDQWVHGTGIPTYRVAHRVEPAGDGRFRVRLRVRQEEVPDEFRAWVPVTLDLGGDEMARFRVQVTGPVTEISLPLVPAEPRRVMFNDLEGVLARVKRAGWD